MKPLAERLTTLPRRQRSFTVASLSMLAMLATTGCRHKAQVSRSYPPPPPVSRRTVPTPQRSLPAYATPPVGWDDNTVFSGRVSSVEVGLASWYGPPYHNRQAANGQPYDQNAMTAAHRTLPLGTTVQVTNLATKQSTTVVITDRGPFVHGRVLDLSLAAAKSSGVYRMGVTQVRIEVLEERPGGAAGAGRWCVQVGAFLDQGHASRLQSELLHRYAASAKVIAFQGPTGYWVRITPLTADRREATAMLHSIRTAEADALPYLVRLD